MHKGMQKVKRKSEKLKKHTKNIKKVKVKEDSKIFNLEKDTIVGVYKKSRNFGFVIPDDKKLGSDIYISKKNAMKARWRLRNFHIKTKVRKEKL